MRALPLLTSPKEPAPPDREIGKPSDPSDSPASLVLPDHPEVQRFLGDYRIHEAAEVIPTLAGEAFEAFVQEIAEKGQREPVVVAGDVLIEGVDIVRAIGALKERGIDIDLQKIEWQPRPGQTVPEFLAHKLLQGPRFTDAQRAQIAVDLQPFIEKDRAAAQQAARIKPGEVRNPLGINKHAEGDNGGRETHPPADAKARNKEKRERSTVGQLAKLANVTEYAVQMARRIKQTASPDDLAAVKAGTKKPKDVLAEMPSTSTRRGPATTSPKVIDHPFTPTTPLQHDLLAGWVRLRDSKAAINERAQAVADMRAILDAEEEEEKPAQRSSKGGAT